MFNSEPVICTDGLASTLGYFDLSLAPQLLNYSYSLIAALSLAVGMYVLFQNKSTLTKILFFQTLFFSLFIVSEIIQWIVIPAGIMHFAYSLSLLLQSLILISTILFVYIFVKRRSLSFLGLISLMVLFTPIVIFLPTDLNIEGIILESCSGVTGALWEYFYLFEIVTAITFLIWGTRVYMQYRRDKDNHQLASTCLLIASSLFLFIFFASYYYADITGIYEVNLVGPIGKLVFIGTLAYLIVRFHAFNIKLLGAQALMVALVILVASQLFFVETRTAIILTTVTLILAIGFGYFLVRSVRKEVEQKEEIEHLAKTLEATNERLKVLDKMKSEFVSIASHQLRSPLTSIRGYASMLTEGSYGKIPAKAQDVVERIADSAKYMAISVEDYLNVSRIEAGNMKYEYSDFSLKDVALKVTDELRPVALKKGLIIVFRSDCDGNCMMHADIGKTRQIIMNLVDNAMKYTLKGTISVIAHDDRKGGKVRLTIHDTGVGMSKETQDEVFEKFVRAKNANNVNVTGTGLGLYVAKKMVTDMGGQVWAESEGEGMGSTFHIEFPLIRG